MTITLLILLALGAPQDTKTGIIKGRVTSDVPVKLILKKEQLDMRNPENVKGELLLPKGGEFTLENIPPGRYDLHFLVQGDEAKKWHSRYWGDLVVEAGKMIEGINYRLTPAGSDRAIDEVIVQFGTGSETEHRKAIARAGGRIKKKPNGVFYSVDIPDDKTVDEMIEVFKKVPGVLSASQNGIKRINSDN